MFEFIFTARDLQMGGHDTWQARTPVFIDPARGPRGSLFPVVRGGVGRCIEMGVIFWFNLIFDPNIARTCVNSLRVEFELPMLEARVRGKTHTPRL